MIAGMIDCTGTRLDFSVGAGAAEVVVLEWSRGAEALDLTNATFRMEGVSREDGSGVLFYAVHGVRVGDLHVTIPALECGEYVYELWVADDSGAEKRLLYGVLTADNARFGQQVLEDARRAVSRRLSVVVPEEAGAPLVMAWRASSAMGALAEDLVEKAGAEVERARIEADRAKGEADRAEGEADRAEGIASGVEGALEMAVAAVTAVAAGHADRAKGEADRAEDAADRAWNEAYKAEGYKEDVLDELREIDEFKVKFWDDIHMVIRPDSSTGTWWVGRHDSGKPYRGENGKSPIVGANGNWMTFSWEKGVYEDSGLVAEGRAGFSPYVDSMGFWVYIDPVTGRLTTGPAAAGKDGLDGEAVVRHVVESYDAIPWTGDTCNGGHVYYVQKALDYTLRQLSAVYEGEAIDNANVRGEFVFSANRVFSRTGGAKLLKLGIFAPAASGGEPSSELLWAHLYYEEGDGWLYAATSTDAVSQVENASSWWSFAGVVLPQGRRVRVLLSQSEVHSVAESDGGTEAVRVSMTRASDGSKCGDLSYACKAWWQYEADCYDGYDVYSWVVLPDGTEGWVSTGAAYDIASADVYGLMKLGTDRVVEIGAPVGRNAKGQAFVPTAEVGVAGTVKVSNVFDGDAEERNEGGSLHMTEDGVILVDKAKVGRFGSVSASYNRVIGDDEDSYGRRWGKTDCFGVQADGSASVTSARAFQWGVVKVGTSMNQVQAMPWIIPVGMATPGTLNQYGQDIEGQLVNNVLFGGALRTLTVEGWNSYLPKGIRPLTLPANSNAVGLQTSDSFSQSVEYGLELEPAKKNLLGGVKLQQPLLVEGAEVVDDDGGDGVRAVVPTVKAVLDHLRLYYYPKSDVYTRDETDAAVDDAIDRRVPGMVDDAIDSKVPGMVNNRLAGYATKVWVEGQGFASAEEVASGFATLSGALGALATKKELAELVAKLAALSGDVAAVQEVLEGLDEVYVRRTETWSGNEVMTEEEYMAMGGRDAKKIYFII